MTFRWQGNVYDTSQMKAFPIGSAAMPFVYLDECSRRVFVLRIDRQDGVEMHMADSAEIESLATRYGITELLTAVPPQPKVAASTRTLTHALIVEDDALSRHALQALLRRSGYDIDSAATVSEAVAKLNQGPKCLILDLNLPDGDGMILLKQIRAGNLPIKVAVTTGATDPAQLDKMSEFSPDAVFRKPLNLAEVMHWLEAAA